MLKISKSRLAFLVVALAMFLVVAATAGAIWHHHATAAAETNCAICHLGHQPFQQPVVIQSTPVLFAAGPGPVYVEPLFLSGPNLTRTATRAPPTL